MNEKLEKRMYFLTMYNISEIQKAIQCGHAQNEYTLKYWDDEDFQDWAKNWKTWIILNGGTSNDGRTTGTGFDYTTGTMENYLKSLEENGIKCASFYEPDLNWCLSSIAFVIDERVFNRDDYPDFKGFCYDKLTSEKFVKYFGRRGWETEPLAIELEQHMKDWVELIGGEKNVFLKTFISQFRLA